MPATTHDPSVFLQRGWQLFDIDKRLYRWVQAALPAARRSVKDPAFAQWMRYQRTWFAGVNALPNDRTGAVDDSGPLSGCAVAFARAHAGMDDIAWDRAQVSVCYPGYPLPAPGQSEALFRFRRDRDAAHVDGLLPEGAHRQRHLREHHAFILGVPMVAFNADAAPFVVWEKSHELVRESLANRLAGIPAERWGDEDLTEAYQRARQRAFETCRRVVLHARPGGAFIVHRLCVHGMAPWGEAAQTSPDGRMICYFRPAFDTPERWLAQP